MSPVGNAGGTLSAKQQPVPTREKALSQIAGQIAMYAINAAQGNIDVSNTQVARSNLDAILKAARLNDADAKNVLMEAIVKITMNA